MEISWLCGKFNIGEIDADTSSKIEKQILVDEFDDPEFLAFAIEHYSEMFGYINTGRVNISLHRDIEGKMWFWVGGGYGCELIVNSIIKIGQNRGSVDPTVMTRNPK